jgi:hypothetical protein
MAGVQCGAQQLQQENSPKSTAQHAHSTHKHLVWCKIKQQLEKEPAKLQMSPTHLNMICQHQHQSNEKSTCGMTNNRWID